MEDLKIKVTQFAIEHHIFTWVNAHCQKQEYLIQYSPHLVFNIKCQKQEEINAKNSATSKTRRKMLKTVPTQNKKKEMLKNFVTSPGFTQFGVADSLTSEK